ncbi:MAG: cbb3-type cytochrome c oxidase subunit 3 [Lysobacterales bacterium]|jgi:cbb3-type cytochrome oxidase subunit 3
MGSETFDINLARGAVLVLLIFGFAGIWAWAWSKKRTATFRAMSMLPLEEDDGTVPQGADGKNNETRNRAEGTEE